MTHTTRRKTALLNRVRRIAGQVEAVERALNAEADCAEILQLIASIRGATNGLMAEIMEDHVRLHVKGESLPEVSRAQGMEELIGVIRTYLK